MGSSRGISRNMLATCFLLFWAEITNHVKTKALRPAINTAATEPGSVPYTASTKTRPVINSAPATPGPAINTASTTPGPAINTASTTPGPTINTASTTPGPTINTASTTPGPAINTASTTPGPTINTASTTHGQAINTASTTPGPAINIASTTPGPTINTASTTPGPTINTASTTPCPAINTASTTPGPAINTATTTPGQAMNTTSTTSGPAMNTTSTTHGTVLNSDSVTAEPELNPESTTRLPVENTELTAHETLINTKSATPGVLLNTESITHGTVLNTDSITPGQVLNLDSTTHGPEENTESTTPGPVLNTESTAPASVQNTESTTPKPVQYNEESVPKSTFVTGNKMKILADTSKFGPELYTDEQIPQSELKPTPTPEVTGDNENRVHETDSRAAHIQDPTDFHLLLSCDRGSCENRCLQAYIMPQEWSSDDSGIVNPTDSRQCQCDDLCIVFGDCCYDYFELCRSINISSLLFDTTGVDDVNEFLDKTLLNHSHFHQKVSMFQLKTCKAFSHGDTGESYWVIESCPNDFSNKTAAAKCTGGHPNPLSSIPVSFLFAPGIVFRNVYCGVCHGLLEQDLIPWKSYAACVDNTTPTDYDDLVSKLCSGTCYINAKPESLSLFRRCFDYDRSAFCDPCAESLLSKSYSYKVYFGSRAYKNPHSLSGWAQNVHRLSCFSHQHEYHGVSIPQCAYQSCEGACDTPYAPRKYCQCDPRCVIYGDCCYDYTLFCVNQDVSLLNLVQNTTSLYFLLRTEETLSNTSVQLTDDELGEYTQWITKFIHYRYCMNIYFCSGETGNIWMLSACPRTMLKDQSVLLCEHSNSSVTESLIPVYHKKYSDIIFRNLYCGLCHGFTRSELVPITISIICPITQPYNDLNNPLQNKNCKICSTEKSVGRRRQCLKTDVGLGESIENWCSLYRHEVRVGNETVRNPHCILSMGKVMNCTKSESNGGYSTQVSGLGGLGILFNVNGHGLTIQRGKTCDSNEVYDNVNKLCVRLTCHHGMVAVGGTCLSNGTWFAGHDNFLLQNGFSHFFITVYLNGNKNLTRNDIQSFNSNLTEKMRTNIQRAMTRLNSSFSLLRIDIFINPNAFIDYSSNLPHVVDMSFSKSDNAAMDVKHLYMVNGVINDQILKLGLKSNEIYLSNYHDVKELSCDLGEIVTLKNVTLVSLESKYYANKSDRLYPLKNIAFTITFMNDTPSLNQVMVCDIPLDCGTVIYNMSFFKKAGGSLISIDKNLLLPNDAYFISGTTVFACHNFTRSVPVSFNLDNMQTILTYVMSGISVACLIVTLCVHAILPDLQNLPGRLIMSLSVTMVLAQGLLMFIDLVSGVLCQMLAIALHFVWLCCFSWMTAVSVNLAHTFTCQSKKSSDGPIAKTHFKFWLFATGFPLLIVASSVIIDAMDIPDLFIGYGVYGICWIANPRATLLVFVVPVAAMLLVNTAAFLLTFYNIEKSMQISKKITSTKKDTSKCFIYGKLFVIMGLSWSSSFVAVFTDTNIVWYIFIILNGLQGLYIFVSFVCTKRVKGMLMKKLMGPESNISTTATEGYLH